jgi:hypothetical protein
MVPQLSNELIKVNSHLLINYPVQIILTKLIEYLPIDDDDRIRVHLKTYDNKHLDVTYIFSKENPQKYLQINAASINN